jgi:hypothetical protein
MHRDPAHEIDPAIAALLGPDSLAQATDPGAVPEYICCVCNQPGTLDDPGRPAALIATRYLPAGLTRVRYAHAGCSPSTVITKVARPAIRPAARCCTLLAAEHDPPAALVIAVPGRLSRQVSADSSIDLFHQQLRRHCLGLLTDCCQPLEQVPGLTVRITPGRAVVTLPGGTALYDGEADCTPEWIEVARAAGHVGIIAAAGLDLDAPDCDAAIRHAIASGHAAAGAARLLLAQADAEAAA